MTVKFFLYEKNNGIIFCQLPKMPDNNDFEITGDIIFNNNYICRGVHWENVDWEYSNDGIELEEIIFKYKYNLESKEIVENL